MLRMLRGWIFLVKLNVSTKGPIAEDPVDKDSKARRVAVEEN